MQMPVYLAGTLATHRRGEVLADLIAVQPLAAADSLPEHGMLLMFGQCWQKLAKAGQADFWVWLKTSGRQVLLLPPFGDGAVAGSLDWQVAFINKDKTGAAGLPALLAGEASYGFTATACQFDRGAGHCWDDGSLNTLYYKSHATGGVFSATTLPLWSLTCLDEEALVQSWLEGLFQLAGKFVPTAPVTNKMLELKDSHYALLCCAFGQTFGDINALVARVKGLNIFRIDEQTLLQGAAELESYGLFVAGKLQDKGLAALMKSPYKIYADELKRMTV